MKKILGQGDSSTQADKSCGILKSAIVVSLIKWEQEANSNQRPRGFSESSFILVIYRITNISTVGGANYGGALKYLFIS